MSQPTGEPTATAPECYRHPGRETWIRCQRCDRPICPDCMRSAAVGFQCPSCVKEGAKTTRAGKLPYGGARGSNPMLTSMVLIGLNLAVWIAITANGGGTSGLVDRLALLPQSTLFQQQDGSVTLIEGVSGGAWWQIVTSSFSHVAVWHIALNMFALYVLGPQLESILGRGRFLAIYLVAALTDGVAVMWLSNEHSQTLGASGSLFGLMGAMLVIALRIKIDLQPVLSLVGINVLFTVIGSSFISWQGHLGGFVGGALVTAAIVYIPKVPQRAVIQWAGVLLIALVSVALIVVRANALA